MAKKVQAMVKLQIAAGKATPAPPVGTALGPHGVNIMDFCKNFNAKTAGQEGLIIPAVVTIYADRSYTFITKTPPASILLKKAAKVEKGSGVPNKDKVGTVTQKQVREIVSKAHAAGKQTVAEFVSDASTMSVLFAMGMDFVEGNFLAAPGPQMNYDFG